MNTIPLIFNERQIKRTVLGQKKLSAHSSSFLESVAVMLLNRNGSHYCRRNIENLLNCGFTEIIAVENSSHSYSVEEFAQRYEQVKFVVPLENVTPGDMINIGMAETESAFVLVIWDDVRTVPPFVSKETLRSLVQSGHLCSAPVLQSAHLQYIPVRMQPKIEKNTFSVVPPDFSAMRSNAGLKTVYPFDFMGIYDRQKFMQLGGYDYTIVSPYWQNLDFSLRAWLWGECIELDQHFRLVYEEDIPSENTTADYAQLRFYLKNCAPVFYADHAYIPKIRYFDFARRYPGGMFKAYSLFADARKWVHENRFRFKTDVVQFCQNWDTQP